MFEILLRTLPCPLLIHYLILMGNIANCLSRYIRITLIALFWSLYYGYIENIIFKESENHLSSYR